MLLVVKALSSRGQEIKASAHQFHYGLTVERFTHAQTVSLKIDVMHWFHFFLNRCLIHFGVLEQRKLSFLDYFLHNLCCIMPQNSSKGETSENYLERNPICANRK